MGGLIITRWAFYTRWAFIGAGELAPPETLPAVSQFIRWAFGYELVPPETYPFLVSISWALAAQAKYNAGGASSYPSPVGL